MRDFWVLNVSSKIVTLKRFLDGVISIYLRLIYFYD
jgi:hypothetical protein